jgi:hypothetical protein
MGRLYHLERTLPANLFNTESYPDREFVVLNYGSKDGMHEWVKQHLRPWIERGVVKYYRTREPQYFCATHAKNIVHRLATGEILCNIDADNFVMPGMSEFITETLSDRKTILISPSVDAYGTAGSCGKIALLRDHFYSVGGYDENQNLGWGWEDSSLQWRCRMHNQLKMTVFDSKWSVCINHSNEERGLNFRLQDIVESRRISLQLIAEIEEVGHYVVNEGRQWGFAADLSSDLT